MADIRVIAHDQMGRITFSIDGKPYTYHMDAVHFHNGFFSKWMKVAPGKALNFAKQRGKLIDPKPKPKYEMPDGGCPECGAQTHVEGVPCPNCGYNESFSFKKWLTTEN